MTRKLLKAAAAAIAAAGLLTITLTAQAATTRHGPAYTYNAVSVLPGAAVHTATTRITLRPDSGDHGYWAYDDITRTITLTRRTQVDPSFCGPAAAQCWYYTFVLTDRGTFQVLPGVLSPATGVTEYVAERGTIAGGTATGFLFSSWKRAYTSGVPVAENDNGIAPAGLHTTSLWVLQFFGKAVHAAQVSLGAWRWDYAVNAGADSQCPAGHWAWRDASSGQQGDILAPDAAHCAAQSA